MAIAIWVGFPRSYTKGRPRPIQYIVLHYTAGSEGPTSAESGAAYDKIRIDGTSTHVFADSNSVVREVPDSDTAHAAFYHGNAIGLQLEICGTSQTREQWLDETSTATLRLAAKQTAEWCAAYGVPARRLSVAETRAAWYAPEGQRPKGIVGHVDVTQAYPEDNGTHTDPGPAFPWDVFLGMVQQELGEDGTMAAIIKHNPTGHVFRFDTGVVKHLADDQQVNVAANSEAISPVAYDAEDFQRAVWNFGLEQYSVEQILALAPHGGMLVASWSTAAPSTVDVAALAKALVADPGFKAALAQGSFEGAQRAERE